MQAFYVATIFAAVSLFGLPSTSKEELAVQAIGFQMAVEVARHFNTAIRWTFKMEMDLVAVGRLLKYAELEPEEKVSKNNGGQITGLIEF